MKKTHIGLAAAFAIAALAGGTTTMHPALSAFEMPPTQPPRLAFEMPPTQPPRFA